jgi:predicted alpha-1,6-mannanase (GH76 family)
MEDLDDLTFDLEADGDEIRRTLHRKTWESGSWATVALLYEEKADDAWRAKLALLRMKKVRGLWKKHALVTLKADEARDLAQALAGWLAK